MHSLYLNFRIIILLYIPFTGFTQQTDTLHTPPINFTKLNDLQVADYTPPAARAGKDGNMRFSINLFGSATKGGNGKRGRQGAELSVQVSSVLTGDSAILKIAVTKNKKRKKTDYYYLNPRYGKLTIIADGGEGGKGGKGENGRNLGDGRAALPGGNGGNGGRGGDGGSIKIFFDSTAIPYVNCPCIIYSNRAGYPGYGGMGGTAGATESFNKRPDPGGSGNSGEGGKAGPPVEKLTPAGNVNHKDTKEY